MSAEFGPAGNSLSFTQMGYRSSLDVPAYLVRMGLDVFEYQCGRGVNIGEEKARQLGELAKEQGIGLSVHAPYYISLASLEEEKRDNSIRYIYESARAVDWMGGDRIVVHPGGCAKMEREEATALACETLRRAAAFLDEQGLSHIHICPETMGKVNQLGTLDEVLEMCSIDERMIPCIDFGHLNARSQGGLSTSDEFDAVLCRMGERLGEQRLRGFHAHFSKIAYTAGGEKCHLTFEDEEFGPDFSPLADLLAKYHLSPVIICESAGTQAEDAAAMKQMYLDACEKREEAGQ